MPTWANLSFQNSTSPIMEQLIFFHDHAMMILTMVVMLVLYLMWTLWSCTPLLVFPSFSPQD